MPEHEGIAFATKEEIIAASSDVQSLAEAINIQVAASMRTLEALAKKYAAE